MSHVVIERPDGSLAAEASGDGPAVLLLHGLTATRRYVLHGSRAIERAGHRVISYDARGHGESPSASRPSAYTYDDLAGDALAVLDAFREPRAVLVGHSMGAATAVTVALRAPERVGALVLITPAHRGRPTDDPARWDRLADGLESGGPDGFLAAVGDIGLDPELRDTVALVIRQRLARHRHPGGVAQALRATPRSAAFDGLDALRSVTPPTLVVGSRDGADPDHPLAVAEAWHERIPDSRLIVESAGERPIAWRGAALSDAILAFIDGGGPLPR